MEDIEECFSSSIKKPNVFTENDFNFTRDFLVESVKCKNESEMNYMVNKLRKRYRNPTISKNNIRDIYLDKYSYIETTEAQRNWMIKRLMRKQSGVLVVTIIMAPTWGEKKNVKASKFSCSKDCFYCPIETDVNGNPTQPRSYLSGEPAMRRALRYNFDVKGQFWDRIDCYINNGSISLEDLVDPKASMKMEVIVSGGTFDCYPKDYRDSLMAEIYWAANIYNKNHEVREIKSLEEEIKLNETSKFRVIGLTIETRPDFVNKYSIRDYRRYNVTRVQIGIQHLDDNILRKINRECYTVDTIKAIKILKESGLKVVGHFMPDLPDSSPEKDIWMFKESIENSDLQLDDVKVYPTAICKSHTEDLVVYSKINEWYDSGEYKPYAESDITELIRVVKYYLMNVNPWIRIQRIIRDIPASEIRIGYNKMVNLRQMLNDDMKKKGETTMDIRTMEIKSMKVSKENIRNVVIPYVGSGGLDYFIAYYYYEQPWYKDVGYMIFNLYFYLVLLFNNKYHYWDGGMSKLSEKLYGKVYHYLSRLSKNKPKYILGFCRFRISRDMGMYVDEIKDCSMIREVHVYGDCSSTNNNNSNVQHRGLGKNMVKIAENISIYNNNLNKISVIAGVGTREYYKNKCGYYLGETFMFKDLIKDDYIQYIQYLLYFTLVVYSLLFLHLEI